MGVPPVARPRPALKPAVALLLIALGTAALAAPSAPDRSKPNILFFLVDDMGTQDTSVPFHTDESGQPVPTAHNRLFRTPNMEQLAKQGRRFTQAYAYSVCSPTRVSLVTGQAAPRHRVTNWTHPKTFRSTPGNVTTKTIRNPEWEVKGVPEGVPLLPRLLKEAGYATLFAGKAHFGPDDTPNGDPRNLGFDVNIAGYGGGGPGSYYGAFNYSAAHRKGGAMWDVPGLEAYHGTETFLTEAITLEMKKAMATAVADGKPFFAYMSHYAVHAPFLYPDRRFTGNYPDHKGYALAFLTLVEGMDKSLGDLIAHLDALGEAEHTLILFLSDNGSDSPLGTKTLRGKKGTRYEGGLRVPLIVAWAKPDPDNPFQQRWPIAPGSVASPVVTCLDIMPTLLAVAGVDAPPEAALDGRNILPLITGKGEAPPPATFLTHFPHKHNNTLFSTFRSGPWKLIYNYAPRTWELYHLEDDPLEQHNLATTQAERARTLGRTMVQALDALGAQYPVDVASGLPVKPD